MNHRYFPRARPPCAPALLVLAMAMSFQAWGAPVGGVVAAGVAGIATNGAQTTITQGTPSAIINWQGFGIAAGEAVRFQQPSSSSVVLNRVVGPDPSAIFGNLSANGKVFLVNPGGVLFGAGASVNVGGLVASTLNIADQDFMAGRYKFSGTGRGSVVNHGTINADGGFVALLGTDVANHGVITSRMGSVALAAGEGITLDVLGDNLLNVTVDRAAVDALVQNGGLLRADGGNVLLTAQAAGSLLSTAVNNTGVIQAQTIDSRNGTIRLMGNMINGSIDVAGTLDASAPNGGDGGFIETSAARVKVQGGTRVTTLAARGRTGEWLIDPDDFVIGSAPGNNISGADLSNVLTVTSVVITTATPGPDATVAGTPPVRTIHTAASAGNGDIFVNDAVTWTAAPSTTTLTLNAVRDVNINAAVSATNGNFVVCCGRDVNLRGAITTVNGSVLLSAGRNLVMAGTAAVNVTDGNLMMCAANDVRIGGAITLVRGAAVASQSLGLPTGLVLSAGTGGTGPGVAGGTLVFDPLAPRIAVTGPNADVTINYNPPSYTLPQASFGPRFTLVDSILTQRMLVFGISADKTVGDARDTTLVGLKGNPADVTLVQNAGATATFDSTAAVGVQGISFTGYSLGGPARAQFALAEPCCSTTDGRVTVANPRQGRTLGTVLARVVPPPPPAPTPPPAPAPPPVPPVPPIPPAPVPVPVVIIPPPVIIVAPPPAAIVPDVVLVTEADTTVMPQFVPFLVSPMLLKTPMPLLVASPTPTSPMELVLVQAPAPAPVRVAAPAPAVVAPVPVPVPVAPVPVVAPPAPRLYRN